jgi:membrane protein implicated in regulation of membrane protease activity
MVETIQVLDVVAVLKDLPEHGLVRGQVGTVVEKLADGTYEVEFSDDEGRTYALLPLHAGQLMRLHHRPVGAA